MLHDLHRFAEWFQHATGLELAAPRFWLDAIVITVFLILVGRLIRYKWLFIICVLPGTIAHELAHWSIALLSGGRPEAPSLWPQTEGQRWTLGHVIIRKPRWYNLMPIALAPLLLLPLAIFLYGHWPRNYSPLQWQHWLGIYCVAMLLHSSLPSREDFGLLVRYRVPLIIIGISLFILLKIIAPHH